MSRHPFRMSALVLIAAWLMPLACGGKKPPPPPAPPPPVTSPPPVSGQPPPAPPPAPQPTPQPQPPAPQPTEQQIFDRMSIAELNAQHPLDDVYFAYDKSDLSDTSRASLQKNATWLRKWTTTKIKIEGHADDRGTNEYNQSLGDRRAAAVRDYLVSLGVPEARIAIVSYGEEQPICREENEGCWSKNRRGHFDITAK